MAQRVGRRKGLKIMLSSGAVAALLLIASVAWACTAVMGTMTLSPNSGKPGTSFTATASGLRVANPAATYTIRWNDVQRTKQGKSCHSSNVILASSVPAPNGSFTVQLQVPSPTQRGKSKVCGLDDGDNSVGTQHKTFTVI
ncbi:MAG: hypothetical protein ACRDJ4_07185 [Actinomycetota bacterium]